MNKHSYSVNNTDFTTSSIKCDKNHECFNKHLKYVPYAANLKNATKY